MKRGLTTLLATAAFLAGHLAARVCLTTMSLPAPHKAAPSHSCCHKSSPENPKAPAPKACCCSEGTNLAVTDESLPGFEPGGEVAFEDSILVPELSASEAAFGGRAPPDPSFGVPLYTLHTSLLI